MPIGKMVMFYQYFDVFLATPEQNFIVSAKAIDGSDPVDYPAIIYDLNGNNIGVANSKEDFIQKWNANPTNAAAGILSGWYGPFNFQFIAKTTINIQSDSQDQMDFVIDSDGQIITDSDGEYIAN